MAVVLARITADGRKPFTAGLLFINNVVSCYAPILKDLRGMNGHEVKAYCDRMGWKIERVPEKFTVVPE